MENNEKPIISEGSQGSPRQLAKGEKAVADFKSGKEAALKALVGKVMALSKGKANPQVAEQMLRDKLSLC